MSLKQVLRRFDVFVYRDLVQNIDRRQVPAAARLDFYEQGATVNISDGPYTLNGGDERDVDVWNVGTIQDGSDVLVGPSAGTLHVVTADVANRRVLLRNLNPPGGPSVVVTTTNRLLRLDERPFAQLDPTGESSGNPFVDTDPTTGRAFCYLRAFRFDMVLSGAGLATKVFVDADGGFVIRT